MIRNKKKQGRRAAYGWGSIGYPKEKNILNNWYSFVCSYSINILLDYFKQFCWFKEGRC